MGGGVKVGIVSGTLASVWLAGASVTVTTIEYWPAASSVPAAGLWVIVNWLAGVQLSLATTLPITLGTAAWQFALTATVSAPDTLVITGAVVSLTVTSTLAEEWLPAASVTVTVIVCCP